MGRERFLRLIRATPGGPGGGSVSDRSCALVLDRGNVLLVLQVYRGRTFWTLPGGGVEPQEHPAQAARREVREETGLDVRVVRHLLTTPRQGAEGTYRCYLAAVLGGTLALGRDVDARASPELQALRWVAVDDARRLPKVARALDRLTEAEKAQPERGGDE